MNEQKAGGAEGRLEHLVGLDPAGLSPASIMEAAVADHRPVKVFAGFSGGDGSLVNTHWMMSNIPGCEVVHLNTGIGIAATRRHVRRLCDRYDRYGWPLTEIRAKEDCGQDYDELVKAHGFPGPPHHGKMQQRLKGRAIRELTRRSKKRYSREKILISTGICHDDSVARSGYSDSIIDVVESVVWVNPLYWWSKPKMAAYRDKHRLERNPVSVLLGMSGECLCGAFAHPGELALIKMVCPETHERIVKLEQEVRAAGHDWGWEERPPKACKVRKSKGEFTRFCHGCEKSEPDEIL